MTDLEITKRCAEAMGYKPDVRAKYRSLDSEFNGIWVNHGTIAFDPLHNDEQVMALVKKFKLGLAYSGYWSVYEQGNGKNGSNVDLNYAICECVAKIM